MHLIAGKSAFNKNTNLFNLGRSSFDFLSLYLVYFEEIQLIHSYQQSNI